MRKREYLSPSALNLWRENQDEYYMRYLSETAPPKIPQTTMMAVGSAFDAYVKTAIRNRLGLEGSFEETFEQEVEPQNRDVCREIGSYVMKCYADSGVFSRLMQVLHKSPSPPMMQGQLQRTIDGVPVLGKPDLVFEMYDLDGVLWHVVLDWKVTGFYSKAGKSPTPGYLSCRDGWIGDASRSHGKAHKDATPHFTGGMDIDLSKVLVAKKRPWAEQCTTYARIGGVDGPFIIAIHELCCAGGEQIGQKIRVAEHACENCEDLEGNLFRDYKKLWSLVKDQDPSKFFYMLSPEESVKRCESLDGQGAVFSKDDDKSKWLSDLLRGHKKY